MKKRRSFPMTQNLKPTSMLARAPLSGLGWRSSIYFFRQFAKRQLLTHPQPPTLVWRGRLTIVSNAYWKECSKRHLTVVSWVVRALYRCLYHMKYYSYATWGGRGNLMFLYNLGCTLYVVTHLQPPSHKTTHPQPTTVMGQILNGISTTELFVL